MRVDSRTFLLNFFLAMTSKHINNSVLSPTAHSTKLCASGNVGDSEIVRLLTLFERLKCTHEVYYVIFMLQIMAGLRISEVLNIRCQHITNLGAVNVRGLKGSNNKFVNVSEVRSYLMRCKALSLDPFVDISRFMVYRFYKKHNVSYLFNGAVNCSVTHYLRHLFAMQVNSTAESLEDVSLAMAHKSSNSTKHYIH